MGLMDCMVSLVLIVVLCLVSLGVLKAHRQINTTEFNSCSCDMIDGKCDIYCCCDKDCSEFLKKSFICKDEMQASSQHSSWKCSNLHYHGDLSMIFCIEKENNPVIGLFHPNLAIVQDLPSMNYLLHKKIKKLNIEGTLSLGNVKLKPTNEQGYVYGQELSIITKNLKISEFYIPFSIYDSACDYLHPVQYLKDISSVCNVQIKDNCLKKQLNMRTFLLGPEGKAILGSLNDEFPLDDIKINYYKSTNLCCYIKSKECANIECKSIDLMQYINNPETPFLEHKTCKNALLEVQYLFFWIGNQLRTINITMVLGDIPVDDAFISQHFSANFRHIGNINEEMPMLKNNTFSYLGYKLKEPVLALFKVSAEYPNSNETLFDNHIFYWTGDSQGACVTNEDPVLFGVDKLSGCWYHISDWDTMECDDLRKDLEKIQSTVMAADFISKSRLFDFENRNLVEVMLKNDSVTNDSNSEENRFACTNISQHVHFDIVYSEALRTAYGPVYTILSAVRSVSSATFRRPYGKKSSNHPIYSSVKFRYLSIEDEDRRKRAKRSELPMLKPWQVSEGNGWSDILYPFAYIDFAVYSLDHAIDVFYLVVLFIASSIFLLRMSGSFHRSSAERP